MIVRILSEGQFELSDSLREQLNALDNRLVDVIAADDERAFESTFREMVGLVLARGRRLEDIYLGPSDVVLPAPDSTLAEVKDMFVGEGLIPG
ncbi:MAG: hypothetical protein HY677_03065 [Chloroflexi bacterium]|nr:hypothetical protein [Chloroflexota bacterium]